MKSAHRVSGARFFVRESWERNQEVLIGTLAELRRIYEDKRLSP